MVYHVPHFDKKSQDIYGKGTLQKQSTVWDANNKANKKKQGIDMLQNIQIYVNIYINKIKTNEKKNISHYVKLTDHLWFKTRFQKSGLTCIICGTKHTLGGQMNPAVPNHT